MSCSMMVRCSVLPVQRMKLMVSGSILGPPRIEAPRSRPDGSAGCWSATIRSRGWRRLGPATDRAAWEDVVDEFSADGAVGFFGAAGLPVFGLLPRIDWRGLARNPCAAGRWFAWSGGPCGQGLVIDETTA